jgi:hypothetical protein
MTIPKVKKMIKQIAFFVLCLINVGLLFAQQESISFSPVAGAFSKTTYVEISSDSEAKLMYRFAGSYDDTWMEYKHPLRLSALPGEERVFTLQVKIENKNGSKISSYRYTIDRLKPDAPEIEIAAENGTYFLQFSPQQNDTKIKYWLSSFDTKKFKTWNGESLQVEPGISIKAYSEDSAGNSSTVSGRTVRADTPCRMATPEIELLSPVKGTFANTQWLVVPNARCYEWIRYSVNGQEPRSNGASYDEPVLIQSTGRVQLRIQAKPYQSDRIQEKSIQYRVNEPENDLLMTFSPLGNDGIVYNLDYFPDPSPENGIELYYSLDDSAVSLNHSRLDSPVQVKTSEGMRNYIPYRIGAYDVSESRMHQFRFFYIFDRRVPANPQIKVAASLPFRRPITIEMHSSDGADIYYSTDGSTPDRFSQRYTGPISLAPKEVSKLGVIPLQAFARYSNGISSAVVRKLLSYDLEIPEAPTYKIMKQDSNGADIRIQHPDPEVKIVYAIGYGETPLLQINADSPAIPRIFRVDFPSGYSGGAFLRFAAKDKAGNLSSSTTTAKIDVDSVPPPPPVLQRNENSIRLQGSGDIYYRINTIHSEWQKYQQTIEFEAFQGELTEYRIDYFAQDELGNHSQKRSEHFAIDNRIPSPPKFFSSSRTDIANTTLHIRCIAPYPDVLIYYQLYRFTEDGPEAGSIDRDRAPGFDDTQYSESIQLAGSDDREIRYLIKARSYLPTADAWSETVSTEFTIDKKTPQLPNLQQIVGPGLFTEPVTLRIEEPLQNQDSWVFIEAKPENDTKPEQIDLQTILTEGTPLTQGVVIEGTPGDEISYRIVIAAVDKAGNSSISEPLEITIDRKKPNPPELHGLPTNAETTGPIEIFPPSDYPHKIVYELRHDGSIAHYPDKNSNVLGEDPLVLEAASSNSHTSIYSLAYRGIDQAGTMSAVKNNIIRISRNAPSPPEIMIEQLGEGLFLIQTEAEKGTTVYAKINGGKFQQVSQEIRFYQSRDSKVLEVSAYAEDGYGNKSNTVEKRVSFEQYAHALVTGVQNGGLYTEDITIRPANSNTDIRYELSNRNTSFDILGDSSPTLDEPLKLEVSEGQTVHYVLRVGVYNSATNSILGTNTYRFTIDKTAPLAPEIVGIQTDYHYTEDQTVRILAEDDASVYFRTKEVSGPETSFRSYVQPEKVRVRSGTRKDIIVEAWSEDQAGNQSRVVRQQFVIDKASIYVAPDGKDAFSGGKENPFRSIDRAFYEARTTNRNTIYLASGEYEVSKPVAVENQLNIIGGLNRETWQTEASGHTFLSIGNEFNSDKPLFSVRRGSLKLENLVLSNIDLENALCVQEGEHSTLIIRDSRILHANGNAPTLIWSKSGNFVLNNSVIEVGPVQNGLILRIKDSSAVFRSSTVTSKTAAGKLTLLDLDRSDLEIVDSELSAEQGQSIRIISGTHTDINIANSLIMYGGGAVRSTGIRQLGGKLLLKNSTVGNASHSAHIASGMELENVNAELSDLRMVGNAAVGMVQIRAKNSSLNLTDSTLHNTPTQEFSYLLRAYGGSSSIKNTTLTADSSYDVYGIELQDSAVAMLQDSTVQLQTGESSTYGITSRGPVVCTIQESRLRADAANGAAGAGVGAVNIIAVLQDVRSTDIKLVNNLFSGWKVLLESPSRSARSVEELEAELPPFDTNNPHRGNRVK